MRGSLHIFSTRVLPDLGEGNNRDVLLIEPNAEAATDAPIVDAEDLEYATTLVATFDDLTQLAIEVNEWWQELAGVHVLLQLVTDEPGSLSAHEQDRLRKHPGQGWSINTGFVAYRADSPAARRAAFEFLVETSLVGPGAAGDPLRAARARPS